MEHNHEAHYNWNADKGDQTHRLNYNLNENSLIFDVGGFTGEWSANIYNRYRCNIYIFEPVDRYFNHIKNRFQVCNNVQVFNFGLGNKSESIKIRTVGDGSKFVTKTSKISPFNVDKFDEAYIKSICDFIRERDIQNIDLLKLNIEGAEYALLESLIEENMLHICDNIQVQFHTWEPNCEERRIKILEALDKTHNNTFSYPFIWEGFKRK